MHLKGECTNPSLSVAFYAIEIETKLSDHIESFHVGLKIFSFYFIVGYNYDSIGCKQGWSTRMVSESLTAAHVSVVILSWRF